MTFEAGKLYDTAAVQEAIGLTYSALAKWRHFGRGPAYVKIGSRIAYRGEDLNAWLERQRVETEVTA